MDGGGAFVLWVAERFSAFAVMAAFCAFASLCCAILYQGREPRRVKLERMRARKNHVSSFRYGANEYLFERNGCVSPAPCEEESKFY